MARQNDHKTTNDVVSELNVAQRRTLVANLMVSGWSYREIAEQLGVNKSTIGRDVNALRDQWYREAADDHRRFIGLQTHRLTILLNTYWEDAAAGNNQAADIVLKIMREQSALYGYPHKYDIPDVEERAQHEAQMGQVDTVKGFLAKAPERQRQLAEVIYAFEGPAGYIEDGEDDDVIEIAAE